MTGCVLDLKRLSVHDGPGLRTTLFLKGCPLNCRWCHNPESLSSQPEIAFASRKCLGCGQCAEVCPTGAHSFKDGVHHLDHALCTACGNCVAACLPDALQYLGKETSAAAVVAAVLADQTFYQQSGGGCTISGGEPLLQPAFCAEVFELLSVTGIHCALDTSGAVAWQAFELVLPHTDLFLYDVKHVDDRLHREQTGSSNRDVLANLKRLSQTGKPIEIRLPIIPGFNADEPSLTAIADMLSDLPNLTGVRLLPYHLARSKYELLGRPYPMADAQPPDASTIAAAEAIMQRHGLHIT